MQMSQTDTPWNEFENQLNLNGWEVGYFVGGIQNEQELFLFLTEIGITSTWKQKAIANIWTQKHYFDKLPSETFNVKLWKEFHSKLQSVQFELDYLKKSTKSVEEFDGCVEDLMQEKKLLTKIQLRVGFLNHGGSFPDIGKNSVKQWLFRSGNEKFLPLLPFLAAFDWNDLNVLFGEPEEFVSSIPEQHKFLARLFWTQAKNEQFKQTPTDPSVLKSLEDIQKAPLPSIRENDAFVLNLSKVVVDVGSSQDSGLFVDGRMRFDVAISLLHSGLPNCENTTILDLSKSYITKTSTQKIFEMVNELPCLEVLNLMENDLKNSQDFLKKILNLENTKWVNVVSNDWIISEAKSFFPDLEPRCLLKLIWLPLEWINAPSWPQLLGKNFALASHIKIYHDHFYKNQIPKIASLPKWSFRAQSVLIQDYGVPRQISTTIKHRMTDIISFFNFSHMKSFVHSQKVLKDTLSDLRFKSSRNPHTISNLMSWNSLLAPFSQDIDAKQALCRDSLDAKVIVVNCTPQLNFKKILKRIHEKKIHAIFLIGKNSKELETNGSNVEPDIAWFSLDSFQSHVFVDLFIIFYLLLYLTPKLENGIEKIANRRFGKPYVWGKKKKERCQALFEIAKAIVNLEEASEIQNDGKQEE